MSNRKCADCGCQLDSEEGYWVEGRDKDVCRECYDQAVSACQLCGSDDVMPSDVSEFIVVKCELAVTANKPPGIYRIMHRPFLSIPLIGSGSMDGNDVMFTERLPKRDSEFEISGHICKKCSRPYAHRFAEVYGGVRAVKSRSRYSYTWPPSLSIRTERYTFCAYNDWLEKMHVQATIRDHPETLHDLECEPDDYDWQDFFERYELSDCVIDPDRPWDTKQVCRFKTWHDWMALEHRGVKVYFTSEHQGMYGEGRWERMSLRPEPRFRQMAYNGQEDNPLLIFTHSLPTIETVKKTYHLKHPGSTLWHKYWDGTWEERSLGAEDLRDAITLAIDRGAVGLWTNAPGSIHSDGVVLKLEKAA